MDGIQKTVWLGIKEVLDGIEGGKYGKDDDLDNDSANSILEDVQDVVNECG